MTSPIRYLLAVILVAAALSACSSSSANEVKVTLTDFGVDASRYEFEAGQTYTFVITNEGAIAHEFVIAEPITEGTEDMHEDGEMEHAGLIVEVEEDELPPEATVRVEVTFPSPAPHEPLEFACHTEGHYEAGMKAPITVK